jgi:ribosomal protein S18 acetylase RimI-like enzyme
MRITEELTLRSYQPGDRNALYEIDTEFQHEVDFGTGDPDRPLFPHPDMDDIDGVYTNAGGAFWVLEAPDGEVAGYGAVMRVDERTARLRRFRVRASWRRRGLATRLLMEAERFCREHGYVRVTLGTTDQQLAAQELYRKNCYVETRRHNIRADLIEIEFEKVLS